MKRISLEELKRYDLIHIQITYLQDYEGYKKGKVESEYLSYVDDNDEFILAFTDGDELPLSGYDISYMVEFFPDSISERKAMEDMDPEDTK